LLHAFILSGTSKDLLPAVIPANAGIHFDLAQQRPGLPPLRATAFRAAFAGMTPSVGSRFIVGSPDHWIVARQQPA
jgi:hypothetical protein